MLEQCRNAKERWGGVHSIIDRWLNERRELIVSLFALSGGSDSAQAHRPKAERLERFCEVLVDYVSAGHFEVYQQLISEAQAFADRNLEGAARVIRQIDVNTEAVLAFNDRYSDTARTERNLADLDSRLSALASQLEERFELEDRLIHDLHEAHRERALSDD